jgi:proline-specific permease ProY
MKVGDLSNMEEKNTKGRMNWWQLSLLGVGCTIGTGFFLGSSMAIKKSGPAVLVTFVLAAIGTYIVYEALAKMSVDHPDKGSFRSYAKKAFGKWAGFSNGWLYCFSEILIMGSQLIALGIFTQFWFPMIPLWVLTSIYSVLGLLVLLTGMQGFERMENIFGVIKTAAIFMFIIVAIIIMTSIKDQPVQGHSFTNYENFFSEGVKGIWLALLYAFYAYGGIEVMGLLAIDLKDPKQAPKSGKVMIIALMIIYVVSIGLVLALISWNKVKTDESPFITALNVYHLPYVSDVLNGILIIAGFSTMVAALYAVITILITLAEDQDAPAFLAKKGKWKVPIPAFLFTAGGLLASIIIALLLPKMIFEYITTAAGLMLLYNWFFILVTYTKLMKMSVWQRVKIIIGMGLIAVTVSGTLGEKSSRLGFYVSLLFLVIIGFAAFMMRKKWITSEKH